MSGGITVKEFKHIPGVNDAEYIKKLEELHEIDKGIISKVVAKIKMLSAQSERKDAIEKAVAVEAISDELMSRFDISATYAYDVAESAVNRIEVMAKETGDR